MLRVLSILAASGLGVCSISANAKPHDAGMASTTLEIDITAEVVGHCGIEAVGPRTNDNGRIDRASTVTFDFQLDCNTPFRIGLAAQNGGLRLDGAAPGATDAQGFAILKPYDVALSFATDQAGQVSAGSCAAAALNSSGSACAFYGAVPGDGFSPGEFVTAVQKNGALAVNWQGEDGDAVRLAAGDYRDVITVVVGPRT